MQYEYNAWVPSQSYYAFAQAAGCLSGYAAGSPSQNNTIFHCLVGKDSATLQNASAAISSSGMYGTWGFLPVTDGVFIQQLPSQQLAKKQVNGLRMLAGVCRIVIRSFRQITYCIRTTRSKDRLSHLRISPQKTTSWRSSKRHSQCSLKTTSQKYSNTIQEVTHLIARMLSIMLPLDTQE